MLTNEQRLKKVEELLGENKVLIIIQWIVLLAQVLTTLVFDLIPVPYSLAFVIFIWGCFAKVLLNRRQINKLLRGG